MIKLSPSVLSADFARLGDECKTVLDAGADMIHFDVMDGHFVDNLSFGIPVLAGLRKALPEAYFDVHLMITDPIRYIYEFAEAGASAISIHVEAVSSIRSTLAAIKACHCDTGLVVNPHTPVDSVYPYLDDLSLVLLMSVTPGHGGQEFMPETIDKLKALKAECDRRGVSPELSVDGGIKLDDTARSCVDAGATILVAGSAIFRAADKVSVVREFKNL